MAQFPTVLRDQAKFYATKYGYKDSDLERGFEGYLAHLFAQEAGFEEVLDGQPTGTVDLGHAILRRHDLGVDIALIDDTSQNIMIVQSKWLSSSTKPSFEDIDSFFSIHDRLMNDEFISRGGDAVQELLADYDDKVRDGYSVKLRFVTNRATSDPRIEASIKSAQNSYDDRGESITCEFIDQGELKEIVKQVETAGRGVLSEIEISFQSDQTVEVNSPYHTLIGRISANELRNLYRQHRQQLFTFNIRLPMSSQRSINKAIRETAESEPQHFFYYNNGVSAVCSEFELTSKNKLVAKRFQIINGAQTVGALSADALTRDVYVLFRLTATGERSGGSFTENIIRFNNTQNPIRISDFRANDPVQQFLQRRLLDYSGKGPLPKFYYQAKAGYQPKGHAGKALKSDDLARIRHAFLYGPVPSYKEPKTFWDTGPGGRYKEAFGGASRLGGV